VTAELPGGVHRHAGDDVEPVEERRVAGRDLPADEAHVVAGPAEPGGEAGVQQAVLGELRVDGEAHHPRLGGGDDVRWRVQDPLLAAHDGADGTGPLGQQERPVRGEGQVPGVAQAPEHRLHPEAGGGAGAEPDRGQGQRREEGGQGTTSHDPDRAR
jgi:hypothetical protein